jgi:4'-phosphopantetheinyl transferase
LRLRRDSSARVVGCRKHLSILSWGSATFHTFSTWNKPVRFGENCGLALREGDVHVWRVALDDGPADAAARPELSPDEHARARRMRDPVHGRRYAAAHLALRAVLATYVDASPRALRFTHVCAWCGDEAHGKPVLVQAAGERLEFSLSRAGLGGLIAVAWGPALGVDVERVDRAVDWQLVGATAFSPAEREQLSSGGERRPLAAATLWCRKEAAAKAVGRGLAGDFGGIRLGPATDGEWRTALVPPFGGRAAVPLLVCDVAAGPESVAALAVAASEPPTVLLRDWVWSPSAKPS